MGYLTENMAGRLGITLTMNDSYSTQHHMYVDSGGKKYIDEVAAKLLSHFSHVRLCATP